MKDWQDELRQAICDHCARHGITMAEQSRRMGRPPKFLNKVARFSGVGEQAVKDVARHIPLPESVIRGVEKHAKRVHIVRCERIKELKRARDNGCDCRQPWPVTVRKLKQEKPIYARAW